MSVPSPDPAPERDVAAPVLELRGVSAGYGDTTVLRGIDLVVAPGDVVALLGPNGAGKTTLIRAIAGQVRATAGTVALDGADVTRAPVFRRQRSGLCLVPEGRGVFRALTVRENLIVQVSRPERAQAIERVAGAFPPLTRKMNQVAGTLSGGEQQMLALGRCFLREPRLVLLDEVSMGLAPLIVDTIFDALGTLARQGISLVIVEQYVDRALALADQVHVLQRGSTVFAGTPGQIGRDELIDRYLGGRAATDL
jgi:branched-chain amino acid transport system ATP-binding protein